MTETEWICLHEWQRGCGKCNRIIDIRHQFCKYCGNDVQKEEEADKKETRKFVQWLYDNDEEYRKMCRERPT